jgi:hypothetical protein
MSAPRRVALEVFVALVGAVAALIITVDSAPAQEQCDQHAGKGQCLVIPAPIEPGYVG